MVAMTFREARNELTLELKGMLEKVINQKKNDENYYILVASKVSNLHNDVIENKIILLLQRPKDPIIGTILYYVDNRQGRMTRIWVFPRDVLQPESTINKTGDFSDEIYYFGRAPNR